MASPWKFLARLVSPRRAPKAEDGALIGSKPDLLAIAAPNDEATVNSQNSNEMPTAEKLDLENRSGEVSAEPELSQGKQGEVQTAVASENTSGGDHADLVSHSDYEVAVDAPRPLHADKVATRKKRERRNGSEAAGAVSNVAPVVAPVSHEAISLDDEIRLLRRQLAGKLELQNAQLKKRLERFER